MSKENDINAVCSALTALDKARRALGRADTALTRMSADWINPIRARQSILDISILLDAAHNRVREYYRELE